MLVLVILLDVLLAGGADGDHEVAAGGVDRRGDPGEEVLGAAQLGTPRELGQLAGEVVVD